MEQSSSIGRRRRVAVVEEYVLQRTHAMELLNRELRVEPAYSGSSLQAFTSWLRRADRSTWPHLLVLGASAQVEEFPVLKAVSAMRAAGIRVLVMTSPSSRAAAMRLAAAGVDGLVSIADTAEDFVSATMSVLEGGEAWTPRGRLEAQRSADAPRLSQQEERVLSLYASGLTIPEVADRLGVRQDTARKYLHRVREKFTAVGLPARSKLDLAHVARAEGYLVAEH